MAPKPLSISQDEPLQKADSSLVNGDGDIVCTVFGHKYDPYKACYTACEPMLSKPSRPAAIQQENKTLPLKATACRTIP